MNKLIAPDMIEQRIFSIRGHRIMIDRDLAELYAVPTFVLNQAVKRNLQRFPDGFMFRLSRQEAQELITTRDRFATLKHSAVAPLAFTEFGIAMLSSILRSKRAIQINIKIIQTFIRLRQWALTHKDLSRKLVELEGSIKTHDKQIHALFKAIREMVSPPEPPRKSIGFRPD